MVCIHPRHCSTFLNKIYFHWIRLVVVYLYKLSVKLKQFCCNLSDCSVELSIYPPQMRDREQGTHRGRRKEGRKKAKLWKSHTRIYNLPKSVSRIFARNFHFLKSLLASVKKKKNVLRLFVLIVSHWFSSTMLCGLFFSSLLVGLWLERSYT